MNHESELETLKAELKKLTHKLACATEDTYETVTQRAEEILDELRDRTENAIKYAQKKSKEIDDYVEENPWKSAMIGLAAGFFLGWLLQGKEEKQ